MKTFYVGYNNKPWNNTDFVIMAETKSKGVAETIKRSYNEAYERSGMSCRLEIRTEDMIDSYRYAEGI